MKKIMQKILSVILLSLMVFTIVPIVASATTSGNYTYTVSNGEATIIDVKTSISGNVTIPSTLGGYPLKCIGDYAFDECNNIQRIIIPNGVTYIGTSAFSKCSNLQEIVIPEGVTYIGDNAFSFCSNLQEITIPEGVPSIGYWAFNCCLRLKKITIPDSVIDICNYAFYYCQSLQEITIPKSVASISDTAFFGCTGIQNFVVSKDNENYSNDEFGVLFDKSKTLLVQYPIGNLRTKYTIPEGVMCIGSEAFRDCVNLQQIAIPESVTVIETGVCYNCNNLTDVYFGGNKEQWNKIEFGLITEYLTNATIHYAKHSHSYSIIVTPPSCSEQGYTVHICECGDSYTDCYLDATGEHKYSVRKGYEPTCTQNGYVEYCCDICEQSRYSEVIPTLEHLYSVIEIIQANCIEKGRNVYQCLECKQIYVEELDKNFSIHHNTKNVAAVKATCTTKGYTAGVYCNDCQKYISGHAEIAINPTNHVNTKNVPETPATFENVGYTAGVYCNDCKKYISGHTEIPKLVPEFTDSKDAKESGNNIVSNNGLTVAQLLSQAGKDAVIKTADGKAVGNTALIGTGMILTLADGSKKEIVVYGDSDGDGKISAADARLALRASVKLESYKEDSCYYKAANVDKDALTAADARLILRASVGLEDPKDWMK